MSAIALSLLVMATSGAEPPDLTDAWRRADALHRSWDQQGGIAREAAVLNEADRLVPDAYGTLWRRARLAVCETEVTVDIKAARLAATRAAEVAARAVEKNPDGVEARYYAAVGVAMHGNLVSLPRAIFENVEGQYLGHLEVVLTKEPSFDQGNARAAMGRYYDVMPWPRRDRPRAVSTLREVTKEFPDNLRARYYLGDALLEGDEREEGVRVLRSVLAARPDRDEAYERVFRGWAAWRLAAAGAVIAPDVKPRPPGPAASREPGGWK